MRFLKPLDQKLLHEVFGRYSHIITVEDGTINGGFGSAILEFMADHDYHAKVTRLGIPDRYISHGKPDELFAECGFDVNGIVKTAKEMLVSKKKPI
jgi:1-deoxy-D-xylulose-5-phosphate synthase